MTGPQVDDLAVRPYVVVAAVPSATHHSPELTASTSIVALREAFSAFLRHERASLIELAHRPVTIAELAAGLRLPIGAVVILVADLLAEHLVAVAVDDDLVTQSLIERIRDRVRAL